MLDVKRMPRTVLAGFTTATMVAVLLVASSPAAADGFGRGTQPFDSTPVEPVAGAGSAFKDAAPDWDGGAADPVGAAGSGDWTATDLSHAGSWVQGGASGGFTYTYRMQVPPAAGPTPDLTLAYSSAAHDGHTSGTNNQASWIGDGWSYSLSFIERTYISCDNDDGGNQGDDWTGDLCWEDDSSSVTISLNGVTTSLVRDDDSGTWRAEQDLNWRIEHLGSPASSGSASSERWVITTPDGTKHYFASVASSRWQVPVFGNHPGEPCHKSGDFTGSRCNQAYRWMLDKTVDVHGNLLRYSYQTVTGRYALATDPDTTVTYTRHGWLQRIEYGLRDGSYASAAAKVEFTVSDRCLDDCRDSDGDPKEDSWPDTPWDLHCDSGDDCATYSPMFFSTKRLTQVTTYVAEGTGFRTVDSWALTHEFKDYGDEEQVVLWLASVQHTGHVGGTATLPPVEFGGTFLPNRVDAGEAWPTIWRPRLTSIKNETGGVTTVNYSEPDCGEGDLPATAHLNSRLCYPTKYTPQGLSEPVEAYFHKYVVRSVAESDATGGGDVVWTFYDYSTAGGGTSALWAWNDAEFIKDEDRDWNQWRGYAQVTTRVGDPDDPGAQLRSRVRYFRGLDGDKLPDGKRSVQVTDSQGNTATDHRALAGMEWESASYDDATIIASSTTWYWWSRTAVRSYDGGTLEAFQIGPKRTDTRTQLSATAWRHTRTDTSYDEYGRVVQVDERGDLAVDGDERCLRTTYSDNTSAWLLESVATVEVVSVRCSTTPQRPNDVTTAVRAFYDGHDSHTTAPTRGLLTRVDVLDDWDDGPVYQTVGESTYDDLGREVTATDALGETTTITYTPAGAGPVTKVEATNPAGHVRTSRLEPAWGSVVEATAANQARTVAAYDPLGRRTAVWLPGRDPANTSPNHRFSYHLSQTEPTTVTTETMIWDGSYLTEIALYDSLLRHRQTQAQTYGGRLISQTVYDSYGRIRFTSEPAFNNESGPTGQLVWVTRTNDVARTEYHYDGAGRVTDEVFVVKDEEKWRTSYRYGGHDDHWMTTMIAPQGGTSTATLTNAQGRTVQLRQYHQRSAVGEFDAVGYQYNRHGRLAQVTDSAGNAWQFEYDLRGRQVTAHDPDTGTTTNTYNPAGQITSVTDSNGTTVSYTYDVLGRPTQVWEGTAGTGELLIERGYDGASNGVGLLHTATRWVDGQAWTTTVDKYTIAGQPTRVSTELPAAAGQFAGQYWQSFTYYPDGSLLSSNAIGVGGLAREAITYHYNQLGQPDRMTSSGDDFGEGHVYVDATVYSPYGQLLQRRLGDPDDVGGSAGQAWQTWVYEEGTGRLAEFYFDKDTAGDFDGSNHGVAALSYEYDQAGNILSITDDPVHTSADLAPETQCFQYDHLRRLTEAWAQAGTDDCVTTPNAAVVGGPGAYWSSYEYDLTGNRTTETRWSLAGVTTFEYTYPDGGQDRPHLVTEVTATGGVDSGAQTAFTYDAAGYTTSLDRDGQVDLLDWNPTGRLDTIETSEGTVRFYDDANGNRILRIDPNGDITAWVAGYELTYSAATSIVQASRYYRHGGDTIAVRNGTGDIQWLASDHHGTNQWIVNGDTLTTKVRRYDPFGNERGASSPSWPDQRGFVGGIINDQAGLTTIGAREYEPSFGRFLSRDPIADFTDPQQVNGYAYASNNPVAFSDPTGLRSVPRTPRAGTPGKSPAGSRGAGAAGRKPPRAQSGHGSAGGGSRTGPRERGGGGVRGNPAHNPGAGRLGDPGGTRGPGPHVRGPGPFVRAPGGIGVNGNGALGGVLDQLDMTMAELENYLQSELVMMQSMWSFACGISYCPGYVRDHPPGAYGICVNGSGSYSGYVDVSGCIWYTEEDGIVFSVANGVGGGCCGISGTISGHLTSASSKSEIAGGAIFAGVGAGELMVAGMSGSYSYSGEWTIGGEVGIGVGSGVSGQVGDSETWAASSDEIDWGLMADMWSLLDSNPLIPQNNPWWWQW